MHEKVYEKKPKHKSQPSSVSEWRINNCVYDVHKNLELAVSRLYIDNHFSPAAKRAVRLFFKYCV
jgi:hypothetical protein